MLYLATQSSALPQAVVKENLPEGRIVIRLADNIQEKREEGGTIWEYDEVVFDLPEERGDESVESIQEDFAAWWIYGQQDLSPITVEERLDALEEMISELIGG